MVITPSPVEIWGTKSRVKGSIQAPLRPGVPVISKMSPEPKSWIARSVPMALPSSACTFRPIRSA